MKKKEKQTFDPSLEYGLVLEGGGAKGAYQIGVWKAILEQNIKITGVSGVSVGALNGALICMGNYKKAEKLWKNIDYSQIMNINGKQMDSLIKKDLKNLDFLELRKEIGKIVTDGGLDIAPLKKLIREVIDEEAIQKSPIPFYFGTFSVEELKEIELHAQEIEANLLADYLLASSYFPAFKIEEIRGKKYLDGGMLNNVPINLLVERGYKNIIVIRIFGMGLEKRIKIPEDVNIVEIAPRVNLGKILEFDSKRSTHNIQVGYFDGLRCFKGLKGKNYYLQMEETEESLIQKFLEVNSSVKMALIEYFKKDYKCKKKENRIYLESILPALASELRLPKDWNYEELYITLLELAAEQLKVWKYKIYSIDELLTEIRHVYQESIAGWKPSMLVQLLVKGLLLER